MPGHVHLRDLGDMVAEAVRAAGGPGMQELHPTAFKGAGPGKKCALITDGRFSGGTSGLSVGRVSPRRPARG